MVYFIGEEITITYPHWVGSRNGVVTKLVGRDYYAIHINQGPVPYHYSSVHESYFTRAGDPMEPNRYVKMALDGKREEAIVAIKLEQQPISQWPSAEAWLDAMIEEYQTRILAVMNAAAAEYEEVIQAEEIFHGKG